MRCMGCGEAMLLVEALPDHSLMVPGYERHRLECLACREVEHRLVFVSATERQRIETAADSIVAEPAPEAPEPASAPEETDCGKPGEPASAAAWLRAMDMVRSR